MPELDHHPEPVSLHDCAVCQDRGIEVESREYCQTCYRGKRRKNMDSFADKLRGMPFTDAMWIVAHATIQSERAIAAAELALLKSKLLQAERRAAQPVVLTDEQPDYELHCNGEFAAGASGKNAHLDILHYAAQYAQDGEIEIFKVTRAKIDPAILAAKEQA